MSGPDAVPDREFAAMQSVYEALEPLDTESRRRVFEYIGARLGISAARRAPSSPAVDAEEIREEGHEVEPSASEREFATLADLQDAANPALDKDRVLVTAYWLQICEGAENFGAYSVNQALKELGHGVSHITHAFDALRRPKPSLILQLKKAGKSRQARKTYKVTEAGVAAVRAMIDG